MNMIVYRNQDGVSLSGTEEDVAGVIRRAIESEEVAVLWGMESEAVLFLPDTPNLFCGPRAVLEDLLTRSQHNYFIVEGAAGFSAADEKGLGMKRLASS